MRKFLNWMANLFDGRTQIDRLEDEITEQFLDKAWFDYDLNRVAYTEEDYKTANVAYSLLHYLPNKLHCS